MMVGTSVHNPTIRAGESNEQEDSWDVTSLFVNNPEQLDSLELKIINNDESGKKTFTHSIYAIVSWTTYDQKRYWIPPDSNLEGIKLTL